MSFSLKLLLRFIAISFLVLSFGHAKAEDTARQWLVDMNHSMRALNYEGIIAFLKNNRIDTMKVTHANQEGVEKEHILSLSGSMREVIRDSEKVTCYFPETRTAVVDHMPDKHSLFAKLPEDLKRLGEHYRFILTGYDRVSGREARKISIIPNDAFRYGQKLWIDAESKLPLKYELFNHNGEVVEQMLFTSLSLKEAIPLESIKPAVDTSNFTQLKRNHADYESPIESARWIFDMLPDGFEITEHTRQKEPGKSDEVEHILLSDGFVSVSVYMEEAGETDIEVPRRTRAFGGTNSFSKKLDDYKVTVVGEVPVKTVRLIGSAIKKRNTDD